MMKALILALVGLFAVGLQAAEVKVDPASFFQKITSEYVILIAGSEVPKEDNKFGSVTTEAGEGLMVLPYCHKSGGVCDPGYRSFPLQQTEITMEQYEPNYIKYTLVVKDGENLRRYIWLDRNQVIHFLDEGYTLVSGEAFPLEFIMEKKKPVPPIP